MKTAKKLIPYLMTLIMIVSMVNFVSINQVSGAEVGMVPEITNIKTTETSENIFRVEFDAYDDGSITESQIHSFMNFYDPEWDGSPEFYGDEQYRNYIISVTSLTTRSFESVCSVDYIETTNGVNKYHITYDNINFNNMSGGMRGKVAFEIYMHDEADFYTKSNYLYTDYMNIPGYNNITREEKKTYGAEEFLGDYYSRIYQGLDGWKVEITNKNILEYNSANETFTPKKTGQTRLMIINNKNGDIVNLIVKVEEGNNLLSLNDLTYNFSNSNSGFGYSLDYRIPLSSYQMIYGNTTLAKKYYAWYDDEWGGNCFGMSSTSGMFNVADSGIKLSNFNSTASRVSDLGPKNTGNLGYNLTAFIEAMQVSQYSQKIQSTLNNTENKLSILSAAVKSVETSGKPVIVAVFGNEGGHALLGYKVEKISDTTSYLHVYDCNYPSTNRYIKLTTNSAGNVTGWYYYLNDTYNWGSSYSGSGICYVPYDTYHYMWANRGKITSSNVLNTNSDSVNIYDYNSKLVASVQDGKLTSSSNDIVLVKDMGVTVEGKTPQSDGTKIMMPTDLYTIENKDSSISKFEATMVNSDRAATVDTESDKVSFAVDDSEELNDVLISAKKGEKYSVSLESSDTKDIELVEVNGIGENKKVSITQERGNVAINNCTGANISINGNAISGSGSNDSYDLAKSSARLEYTEVSYDGKSKYPKISIVDANNKLLELGKDYIPFYSNNTNVGVASVTVYGIGQYSGSKTLSFIIKESNKKETPITSKDVPKVKIKAKNVKKKSVKLSWKKAKNADGYKVQYALNKKFTKKAKIAYIKASKTSKTIKKLKKKKTYYFRVAVYRKYKGKKVFGKWSNIKKIKIKK